MAIEDDGRRLVLESNGGAAIAIFYRASGRVVEVGIVDRRSGRNDQQLLTGSGSAGPHPAVKAYDFGLVILEGGPPANYRLEVAATCDAVPATFVVPTVHSPGFDSYGIIAANESEVAVLIFSDD
jgi:predicted short-subunit dehydrogenase-like oxidoreductase (DUF2520 family)